MGTGREEKILRGWKTGRMKIGGESWGTGRKEEPLLGWETERQGDRGRYTCLRGSKTRRQEERERGGDI